MGASAARGVAWPGILVWADRPQGYVRPLLQQSHAWPKDPNNLEDDLQGGGALPTHHPVGTGAADWLSPWLPFKTFQTRTRQLTLLAYGRAGPGRHNMAPRTRINSGWLADGPH